MVPLAQNTGQGCTGPDPDIAGIGVQMAIFIQAFLSFIAPIFAVAQGRIGDQEQKWMYKLPLGNIILSANLIVTAFFRLWQQKLSAHHALIVLQLTWILEGPFIVSNTTFSWFVDIVSRKVFIVVKNEKLDFLVDNGATFVLWCFRVLHAIAGLAVWGVISSGSGRLACANETFFLFPGGMVEKHGIRWAFLILYALRLVEGITVAVRKPEWKRWWDQVRIQLWANANLKARPPAPFSPVDSEVQAMGIDRANIRVHKAVVNIKILSSGAICIFLSVCTRVMTQKSPQEGLVGIGENDWGFGQILPMCLLVSPVVEVGKACVKWMRAYPRKERRMLKSVLEEHIVGAGFDEDDAKATGVEDTTQNVQKIRSRMSRSRRSRTNIRPLSDTTAFGGESLPVHLPGNTKKTRFGLKVIEEIPPLDIRQNSESVSHHPEGTMGSHVVQHT